MIKNRTCRVCGKVGPVSEFESGKNRCRPCAAARMREYYRVNHPQRIKNRELCAVNKKIRVARNRAFVNQAKSKPCTDCNGEFPPYAMDFDHLDANLKICGVAILSSNGASIEVIENEIAKCELVCATCHRIRTLQRRTSKTQKQLLGP